MLSNKDTSLKADLRKKSSIKDEIDTATMMFNLAW